VSESEGLERLIAAEQDERRRLALFLHDGPVQELSGIALMVDGALFSIQSGRLDEAQSIIGTALERQRETIRQLRNLSFALEPVVLRDHGFAAALRELAGVVARVVDDAEPERRRRTFETVEQRVQQLHGELEVAPVDGSGTEIRVTLPSYTTQR
jgi:signal transduction histidine kinase